MARVERPGMESIQEIVASRRKDLHKHAKTYRKLFEGKKVTYYFYSKGVPKRRTIYFYQRNFMHLCGVHRYEGGWKKFYADCLRNRIKASKAYSVKKEYVEVKIDALAGMPKLLKEGYVGFSDDAVVHKGTDYGEMVRTQEDLIALGTIEDRSTKNQVPISLINIEVSTDDMKKATSNWSKVAMIKVEKLKEDEVGMFGVDRERDEAMKDRIANGKKARQAKGKNTQEKGKPHHYRPKPKTGKKQQVNAQGKGTHKVVPGKDDHKQKVQGVQTEQGGTAKRTKRRRRRAPRKSKDTQYQNKDRVQEGVK